MMAKIRSGQGFAGLVDYANDLKNKDTKIIASEGVDLTSNKSIVASFSLQTKSRPSLKNFVGHISLSFAPEDTPKMTDKLMSEITKEYMTSRTPMCISFITGWITTAMPLRATKVSESRRGLPKPLHGNMA